MQAHWGEKEIKKLSSPFPGVSSMSIRVCVRVCVVHTRTSTMVFDERMQVVK